MQGYHFTETVRRVLEAAREEASKLMHESVRPDHLLLGLARSKDKTLLQVWSRLNVDPVEIGRATLAGIPDGKLKNSDSDTPYTSHAKRVLETAMREASTLGDDLVGPTHLLLGLVHLDAEAVAQVLQQRGVTAQRVRAALADLRGEPSPEEAVLSIEVKVALRNGAVVQKTFAAGDRAVLALVSGYLPPE